ncbi:putative pathogenicity factor [Aspergillus fischeri NRRL 181]|uniref:Hypothetical pathogenicity factor n=1 Tax=Neosartorya fischeri (strain ATCC 1020 / DSM 3700 / CBS 544.65 / FGSC A1164 / JCM 1740 / NRRL 181 / WB 181) TaxID=331117 RepID=A1CYM9_NEOFI|nr:hypothetical pathogenicity factor [Aspergillus fischeri NRRL 181]EAW23849.1 hypothetical pathogenicity factor [Aspergillus fischeri NRRL 181]KAG2026739.1 hypothetical protein GB937_001527 [Aspergillus fischeri]
MAPKPKAKPSKQPPHPTPTRQEQTQEPPCEFTHPCTTSTISPSPSTPGSANASGRGSHPRKLISHIFGRNKTSTKLFPSTVWVHYCRKHYQRARYRSRAWPFTQCELLLDSLGRMEAWGGVESFEVVLRRREMNRISSAEQRQGTDKKRVGLRKGRRGGGASASTSAGVSGDEEDEEEEYGDDEEESDDGRKRQRRKPRIKACPVPGWLRAETGPGKSFAEIRAIVERIREDLTEQHRLTQKTKGTGKSKEQVLFPDIEILPTFRSWVLEQAKEDGENTSKKSRVSRKGAVQKVQR